MPGSVSVIEPRFSISPADVKGSVPVTLTLPPTGYKAVAALTNQCGKPIGSVTTVGLTATPHLPAGYTGTSFVVWKIERAGAHTGLSVSMSLAARETIGTPTTCAQASPYSGTASTAPKSHALVVKPAAAAGMDEAVGGATLAVLVAAAVIVVLWWRRRSQRVRGSHAR